jgi:CheY-like chemotaxis protein
VNDIAAPLLMYVEDEPVIQELGLAAFEEAGFAVAAVASGIEAMAALDDGAKALKALITDIDLGTGPNGWMVARRARELCPELPIVYVSGGSSTDWASMGVPGSVMVAKPYAGAELVVAVSTAMLGATPSPKP